LLLLCRWVIDSRDDFTAERLAHLDDAYKIYRCKVSSCAACCMWCVGCNRQRFCASDHKQIRINVRQSMLLCAQRE
jgi:hypothetical protein